MVSLVLSDEYTLHGHVELDGRTASGWSVEIRARSPRSFGKKRFTVTDPAGDFSFPGCSSGVYKLIYADPSDPTAHYIAEARPGPKLIRLSARSDQRARLSGHVTPDPAGPRPMFVLLRPKGVGEEVLLALSASYAFESPLLPCGRYFVKIGFAEIPGLWTARAVQLGESRNIEIAAPSAGSLFVYVDPPAGTTADQATVFVKLDVPSMSGALYPLAFDPTEGAFHGEFAPGKYHVIVSVAGCASEHARASVQAGHTEALLIQPKPGRTVKLRAELPRDLAPREYLSLRVREPSRTIPLDVYFAPLPGDSRVFVATFDVSFEARSLRVGSTQGLAGELALDGELRSAMELTLTLTDTGEK